MRLPLFVFAVATVLAGCAGATFEDTTPQVRDWSYFDVAPSEVVGAIREAYALSDYRVASVETDEALGGTIVTITARRGSAGTSQVLVQPTSEEGYQSRAQTRPGRRSLPRALEVAISGRG